MNDDLVRARYRGAVTVGSPGRARLHDRDGGIDDLVWEALGQAGWLGHTDKLRPTVELVIRVPPCLAPRSSATPHIPLRPGTTRRKGEGGRVESDGTVCIAYLGPLNPRAAGPGVRLVESERRPEDSDGCEDFLYRAAMRAGWLPAEANEPTVAEIPAADILIRIKRHRPD